MKCLSCDNRYRFFYIVLLVLVMWGRQLNSLSMIMPRCRCSWTCSMWLSLRLRLRISGRSWCVCLVASSILFVFAGCKIIERERVRQKEAFYDFSVHWRHTSQVSAFQDSLISYCWHCLWYCFMSDRFWNLGENCLRAWQVHACTRFQCRMGM